MKRVLFIAPTLSLASDWIPSEASGFDVTTCSGQVDRAKAERFLASEQFEAVHFIGHGESSVLQWADGPVEEAEIVDMLRPQRSLRFVAFTACNSAGLGSAVHNARHVPTIYCDGPIAAGAGRRYSEAFYRSLRLTDDLASAHKSGAAALMKTEYADVVRVINGDMATNAELTDCMAYVRTELGEMRSEMREQFAVMQADIRELNTQPNAVVVWMVVLLALVALGQWAQPWLAAWVAGR